MLGLLSLRYSDILSTELYSLIPAFGIVNRVVSLSWVLNAIQHFVGDEWLEIFLYDVRFQY